MIRFLFLFSAAAILLAQPLPNSASSRAGGPLATTQAAFRQAGCMDERTYRYHKDTILALSYTKMRALRTFCRIPDISAEDAVATLERLVFFPAGFAQVRFLEAVAAGGDVSLSSAWKLLELTADLEFTALQAMTAAAAIEPLDGKTATAIVARIDRLDDGGRWAATALFGIAGIDRAGALSGLDWIERLSPSQRWAAEQGCLIDGMTPGAILAILPHLARLEPSRAITATGLFAAAGATPESALFWVRSYLPLPVDEADERYLQLAAPEKSVLLNGFAAAGRHHIRAINDLHAVTNRYGGEIGTAALTAGGFSLIRDLFDRLHPAARDRYRARLREAERSGRILAAVAILREATALARKETARDLGSADIYVLLAHGSELYDSSFRDILVPVLLARIEASHRGNLLFFLRRTDPESRYVSDFIVSCAQKGKLAAFFPEDAAEQRAILDLMAQSAFRDEQSLILFAATFATVLEKLAPEARSHLIGAMAATIDRPDSLFSLQLRVILQYYADRHPDLLAPPDQRLIASLIENYGRIDLSPFTRTDFARWKADNLLASVSVFQHDDDGRRSYLSYSRNLLEHGYRARLSTTLAMLPPDSDAAGEAARLIRRSDVASLYRLSVVNPLIVEYHKTINGIELSHSLAVYQDEIAQRRLLEQFLAGGMEMFAQRGHSYWREEQLLAPVRQLLDSGGIDLAGIPALNRFMSIGSCGGIRVYSELTRLFAGSVDIFATVGTGTAAVNDPYNRRLFEIVAATDGHLSWDEVAADLSPILADGRDGDYLQPGSLPAILHKMMDVGSVN